MALVWRHLAPEKQKMRATCNDVSISICDINHESVNILKLEHLEVLHFCLFIQEMLDRLLQYPLHVECYFGQVSNISWFQVFNSVHHLG